MSGVVKILAKEIVELAHRPFLLFWLATLPILLTLVAGSISKGEPHETLVLAGRTQNETETGRARQLLAEIAGLIVVEIKGPVPDIVAVMERERAGLALVGDDRSWQVIERSSSRVEHRQLMSLAYQIATSLNLNRPWQLAAAESITARPAPPPLPPDEGTTDSPGSVHSEGGVPPTEGAPQVPQPQAEAATQTPESTGRNVIGSPPPAAAIVVTTSKATVASLGAFDGQGEIWLVAYVIALLVAFLPFMLTCNSLVREQDTATLERLLVVPGVSWIELLIGKALLPLLLGTAELFVLMLLAELIFHTQPGPAGPATVAIQFLALLSSTLIGVTVATLVRSQLQGYLTSALYLICLVLFTGFIFPIGQAQPSIKLTSHLLPLTFSLEPLSAWMLLGTDSSVFIPELESLLVQCAVYAGLAALGAFLYRARV